MMLKINPEKAMNIYNEVCELYKMENRISAAAR